jgi:hypothetical protein
MPKRYRQDSAQLNLRLKPAERERIRRAIPRGSLNAVAIQLLLDYTQMIEAQSVDTRPPLEDTAA